MGRNIPRKGSDNHKSNRSPECVKLNFFQKDIYYIYFLNTGIFDMMCLCVRVSGYRFSCGRVARKSLRHMLTLILLYVHVHTKSSVEVTASTDN